MNSTGCELRRRTQSGSVEDRTGHGRDEAEAACPLSGWRSGRDRLNLSLSAHDPGCVKTLYFIMIGVVPAL